VGYLPCNGCLGRTTPRLYFLFFLWQDVTRKVYANWPSASWQCGVSKFETQGTRPYFGVTSRIQVSCCHQPLCCTLRVFISTAATYRDLHIKHRSFRGEPPRQAWPSVSQSSSRWTTFGVSPSDWRLILRARPDRLDRLHRTRLALPSEDGGRAAADVFSLLLPMRRRALHQRQGPFLHVVLCDFVSLYSGRRGCASGEGKI
jgi:hypothetical protein